jgi:hypothetical protein
MLETAKAMLLVAAMRELWMHNWFIVYVLRLWEAFEL